MKVLLLTHSYGNDGAAVMLCHTASYWARELGWQVDALCWGRMAEVHGERLAALGIGCVAAVTERDGYDFVLINTIADARFIDELYRFLPLILWVHEGNSIIDNLNVPVATLRRWFFRARRVVFQSDWQAGSVFRSFIHDLPAERVRVVANGLPAIEVAQRSGPLATPPRIVCVGQVCGRKRQGDLALAVAALARKQDVACTLVGDATGLEFIEAGRRNVMSEHPAIRMTGGMPRPDTLALVAASDIFVLPSGDESQPLAPLEAAWLGVPVVLADLAVYRHVGWRDGENCLMFRLGDTAALEQCLARLIAEPILHARLAAQGRAFAAGFGMARFLDEMTQVATGLVAGTA